MEIVDGDGTTILEKSCGSQAPSAIFSNSEQVLVAFHSDHTEEATGFQLVWKEIY